MTPQFNDDEPDLRTENHNYRIAIHKYRIDKYE
jgi:hypothetical protein